MTAECRHIKSDGYKCCSIALAGKPYCRHHMRVHRAMTQACKSSKSETVSFEFDFPDSRQAIQLALFQILNAIGSGQIDPRRAGSLLYGLQIATQNVDHSHPLGARPAHCVTLDENGDEMGPVCDGTGPGECGKCIEFEHCARAAEAYSGECIGPSFNLKQMIRNSFWKNLSGLSSERWAAIRDELMTKKSTDSKFVSLSSLLGAPTNDSNS
jgi:hypothetical protein